MCGRTLCRPILRFAFKPDHRHAFAVANLIAGCDDLLAVEHVAAFERVTSAQGVEESAIVEGCACLWSAHLGGVDGFHGCCALVVVVGKRISGNAPPPLITHEQEKECLPNLFILATAYKPPTSLPCLDATESTGYLTACMSSVASVSASLPCFVDGGQGTKQKGRRCCRTSAFVRFIAKRAERALQRREPIDTTS